MPIVRCSEAETHEIHGARFVSYAAPRTGSRELCAWRGEIPAGTKAPAHTVDREEILHLLTGELLITLDGRTERVTAGDTVIVNPGATLAVENPTDRTATSWVTTSVGLTAELADGTVLTPPWAN
ncbi:MULTISPECIES: cupin domain-containing protein [Streptomyces]|uniref:cupin domain-containing protein n=1 Tax=Streptomyces TaxID=1883 RepID=UPI0002F0509D|nr:MULTISPECIES: cupin domain-containing protein [Streptomyces]WDI22957.1 cupin domain-containing protein [Streptomyces enissocaesilis]MBJ6618922.1 cupin domain-containing protein [Streptomyces sp. DHE17-7]MBQ0878931.1 cupin domain-containing protein [Streptomyces sp. RT42]MBQ0913406.1 cupin domain-containing protein [Streptomyces sp. RM99]MBU8548881.1 cupin domain-containing protein [Streptomyces sp. Osf17]